MSVELSNSLRPVLSEITRPLRVRWLQSGLSGTRLRHMTAASSRSWVSVLGNADRTKMIAAVILIVLVIGFFGYRIFSGSAVRVIQNID